MEPAPAGLPFEALSDALGTIDGEGRIAPRNENMRSLLRSLASAGNEVVSLADLPLAPGDGERLAAGELVAMESGGALHELRCCTAHGALWLVASDRGWAQRAAVARLAAARARTVGGLAGSIVPDLANLLGAGIGLAEILRPLVKDAGDARSLDELMRGARQGAALGRTVSRLLKTGPREWAVVPVAAMLDDVLLLLDKDIRRRGIDVAVRHLGAPVTVRVVPEEASQALLTGVLFCIERGATSIVVETGAMQLAVGGARKRRAARVRLVGVPLHGDAVREVLQLAQHQAGLLAALDRLGDAGPSLVHAIVAMACAGGDLLANEIEAGLELDYVWPAVGAAAP